MLSYIVRRLFQAMLLLFLLSMAFFLLVHAMPGGPEAVLFSPRMPQSVRLQLRHDYGLDLPLPLQYVSWLKNVLVGNFGNSFSDGQLVTAEIGGRLPATLELFAGAMLLALIAALLLGVISAVRKYTLTDYFITVLAYFGISMPIFWFGLILQQFFGVTFGWLPTFAQQSCDVDGCFSASDYLINYGSHLILPSIVLSLLFIASWSRYLRVSMISVLDQDYVRTARAKGLRARAVFFRHALRNALIPFVTQVAIDFSLIVGGAVITETVFGWPGLGQLFISSARARDFPILEAYLLMGSASVILFNLLADLLYSVIDPRIRYS